MDVYFTVLKSGLIYSYDLYILKFGSNHSFSDSWPLIIILRVSYGNILEHMISGKQGTWKTGSIIKCGGLGLWLNLMLPRCIPYSVYDQIPQLLRRKKKKKYLSNHCEQES
jgi:hypothetical protein